MKRNYVLIAGHGRSGTNFLLQLLDMSSLTHCRNEPDELGSSLLRELPGKFVYAGAAPSLDEGWDPAVESASESIGIRDHRIPVPKEHFRSLTGRQGQRLWCSPQMSSLLASMNLFGSRDERRIPIWLGRKAAVRAALPVLKMNQIPGWISWVIPRRSDAKVLHIVRHPGGFLASWKSRYLKSKDREFVTAQNRQRLAEVAVVDPSWGNRWGDPTAMTAEESELWYWRYAAESIHAAGENADNYHLVVYDQLTSEPVEISKEVYRFCELPWRAGHKQMVQEMTRGSQQIASAWRQKLSAADQELVSRILDGSTLASCWDDPAQPPLHSASPLSAFLRSQATCGQTYRKGDGHD